MENIAIINMELVKIMTHPSVEYILIIINDKDLYLIWQVVHINFLSEKVTKQLV